MNQAASLRSRFFSIASAESAIIIALALVPLFMNFPYRVNIFLSWEGAYRLSQGQIPYKDFGMPLGYMYWAVPALFFKLFGPQLITLVKAQVFMNILSGFAFRSILKSVGAQPGIRLLSVVLYCISFSFFNFWPWYNHTVIVYEMVGLAFLAHYIMSDRRKWIHLSLAALFVFFSFFTKQDGGGLALILSLALLAHHCFYDRNWKPMLIFLLSFGIVAFAIIAPVAQFSFGYWFNHGQAPHTSRISLFEILDEFFYNSQWIKFYIFLILLIAIARFRSWGSFVPDRRTSFFLLLTLGILAEASILQVTSYTPPDNNIFFHSFAFAFIFSQLAIFLNLDFMKRGVLLTGALGLGLWWSSVFWKYIQRVAERALPQEKAQIAGGENVVNRKTYLISSAPKEIPMSEWKFSSLDVFRKVYMPGATVEGIDRLVSDLKARPAGHFLNMTELTPLAAALPYQLETGADVPLWYHLGVGMFNRQAMAYEKKIAAKYYDIVLFEYVPSLNNFYPFRVRDSLKVHYRLIDSFPAPRRGETQGLIEVYKNF